MFRLLKSPLHLHTVDQQYVPVHQQYPEKLKHLKIWYWNTSKTLFIDNNHWNKTFIPIIWIKWMLQLSHALQPRSYNLHFAMPRGLRSHKKMSNAGNALEQWSNLCDTPFHWFVTRDSYIGLYHRENAGTLGWYPSCLNHPKEPFERGYTQ